MSSTVTTTELQHILSDYKLHLTGSEKPEDAEVLSSPARSQNPPNWPADRNRVPPYRRIDRTLNYEDRPNGSNGVEHAFLVVMFTGVFLNASMAKLWGMTGGPYFPGLFRYAIGGEW